MERSFFLKKRRADFVAGSLSGRVIVAGGLGKDGASQVGTVLLVLGGPLALCMGKRRYWLLGHSLPDLPLYSKKFKTLPSFQPGLHVSTCGPPMWSFCPLIQGKLRPRKHEGHAANYVTQAC